jgi:hypothetical protein
MTWLFGRVVLLREGTKPLVKEPLVADLVFVVLTVVLFAALAVLIRAVERW